MDEFLVCILLLGHMCTIPRVPFLTGEKHINLTIYWLFGRSFQNFSFDLFWLKNITTGLRFVSINWIKKLMNCAND